MTAFTEAFSRKFKRLYASQGLKFPIEMSFKCGDWEVGGITDGKKHCQMFELGTAPSDGAFTLPLTLHGVDANGKQFELELI